MPKWTIHAPKNRPGCSVISNGQKVLLTPGGSAILYSESEVAMASKVCPWAKVRPVVELLALTKVIVEETSREPLKRVAKKRPEKLKEGDDAAHPRSTH